MVTVTKDQPRICADGHHDDRWCPTCEAMWEGARLALVFMVTPGAYDDTVARFAEWAGKLATQHNAPTDAGSAGEEAE